MRKFRLDTLSLPLFLAVLSGASCLAPVAGAQTPAPRVPAATQAQAPVAPVVTLPGGASSLQETFGDWQVACIVQGAAKRCSTSQEQVNQQSRQRVFGIEITNAGDRLEGVLLMPFGLTLDRGVILQLDDQPAQPALKFRTCLPGGCLVPLSFDAKQTATLRSGTALKAKVTAESGQEQIYTISLKGFAQAVDRVGILAK